MAGGKVVPCIIFGGLIGINKYENFCFALLFANSIDKATDVKVDVWLLVPQLWSPEAAVSSVMLAGQDQK